MILNHMYYESRVNELFVWSTLYCVCFVKLIENLSRGAQ